MTITLQDLAYLLGLNIDGNPVSGYIDGGSISMMNTLLKTSASSYRASMIDNHRASGLSILLGFAMLLMEIGKAPDGGACGVVH
ncbi:hypothetical protein AHAS_Ahas09G0139600 [Arachis hypogaea]